MVRSFLKQIGLICQQSSHAIVEEIAMAMPRHTRPKTLLLLRLDAIGDYILFRNFLVCLKQKGPFRDYHITLCGNQDWKDLTLTFDRGFVDECLWIDRRSFRKNLFYKLGVLLKIRVRGFEVVVETRYSREYYYGEKIVRAAGGVSVIGCEGDLGNITFEEKVKTNKFYSKLLPLRKSIVFEFSRNKEIFETLLGEQLLIKKPALDVSGVKFDKIPSSSYVVVFPGGSGADKRWPLESYARVMAVLMDEGVPVVLMGSKQDVKICRKITGLLRSQSLVTDLSGVTDLPQLAAVLARASFLITNETSAVHIAVAVNTPVFCIANGNNFGRFTEYPDNISSQVEYLYPPKIMRRLFLKDVLVEEYAGNVREDIRDVSVDMAITGLRSFREKINKVMRESQ